MMNNLYVYLFTLTFVTVSTVLLGKRLIPWLVSMKMGQKILDIGPRWHMKKDGTPTMGGIFFIFPILIAFTVVSLLFFDTFDKKQWIILLNVLLYSVINAAIGIADDLTKIKRKENKGLSALVKFLLQSLASAVFLASLHFVANVPSEIYVPYVDVYWELGGLYYLLCFVILCGFVNAVNLTDGIDGLASSIVFSIGVFASLVGMVIIEDSAVGFIGGALTGATIGFLSFNLHPARVFMGDTGSLFLGAMVVGLSFLLNNPLLVLVYGFIFLVEAITVILQVLYFKISKGKRLFKMAPIHHHFEKIGMSETNIVILFTAVSFLFCFLAALGIDFI